LKSFCWVTSKAPTRKAPKTGHQLREILVWWENSMKHTCRFTKDGDVIRIASKRSNVILNLKKRDGSEQTFRLMPSFRVRWKKQSYPLEHCDTIIGSFGGNSRSEKIIDILTKITEPDHNFLPNPLDPPWLNLHRPWNQRYRIDNSRWPR
jgi:hypothetical protein